MRLPHTLPGVAGSVPAALLDHSVTPRVSLLPHTSAAAAGAVSQSAFSFTVHAILRCRTVAERQVERPPVHSAPNHLAPSLRNPTHLRTYAHCRATLSCAAPSLTTQSADVSLTAEQ